MVTVTGLYANDTYVSLYATLSYQTFTDRLFPFDSAHPSKGALRLAVRTARN